METMTDGRPRGAKTRSKVVDDDGGVRDAYCGVGVRVADEGVANYQPRRDEGMGGLVADVS